MQKIWGEKAKLSMNMDKRWSATKAHLTLFTCDQEEIIYIALAYRSI